MRETCSPATVPCSVPEQVRCRVGGGQVHLAARLGQRDGDGRGDGGLADPALAHAHDQSVIGPQDLADQPGQGRIGEIRRWGRAGPGGHACGTEQRAQGLHADHVRRLEGQDVARQAGDRGRDGGECAGLPGAHGPGEVVLTGRLGQDSVDDDVLAGDADLPEFTAGAFDLGQRRGLRAADQDHPRVGRVLQRADGPRVHGLLLLQARERAQAGRIALARRQEVGPRPGKLQQADGMPGRRGVEDDVVIPGDQALVGQQGGELIERGDLGRARTGQLLGDRGQLFVREQPAHRGDDPFPVGLRCLPGVDLQRGQARHLLDRGDGVADRDAEDLPDVRRRVGADQQHPLAPASQVQGRGAGDGGLADPALAGEEHEPWRGFQELHPDPSQHPAGPQLPAVSVNPSSVAPIGAATALTRPA